MALRLPEPLTTSSSPQLLAHTHTPSMSCLLELANKQTNKQIWASGTGLQALLGDAQSLWSQKWRVEERGERGGLSPQGQLQAADKGRGSLAGAEQESQAQVTAREAGRKSEDRSNLGVGNTYTRVRARAHAHAHARTLQHHELESLYQLCLMRRKKENK